MYFDTVSNLLYEFVQGEFLDGLFDWFILLYTIVYMYNARIVCLISRSWYFTGFHAFITLQMSFMLPHIQNTDALIESLCKFLTSTSPSSITMYRWNVVANRHRNVTEWHICPTSGTRYICWSFMTDYEFCMDAVQRAFLNYVWLLAILCHWLK